MRWTCVCLLAGIVVGCLEPPPVETEVSSPETLSFVMKTQERTYEDCVAGTEGCTYVRLDYPVLAEVPDGSGAVAEAASDAIREFVFAPLEEPEEGAPAPNLLDAFIADFVELKQSEPGYDRSWFLERKAFVLRNTDEVLSLSFWERAYTGGAHGLETLELVSFDADSGARLSVEDVVAEGKRAELEALAESRFRQARELEEGTSFEEAGFNFENGAFALTNNFAVQEDGLLFYYNPYEVAPYAVGPTELLLSWEELEGLVDPRFAP